MPKRGSVGDQVKGDFEASLFRFSDSWQLVINTGTTIITFLMVFLIQNTQNRDTEAMQIKLDEFIRATKEAHNALLDLEELDEKTLNQFRSRYEALALKARAEIAQRNPTKEPPKPPGPDEIVALASILWISE